MAYNYMSYFLYSQRMNKWVCTTIPKKKVVQKAFKQVVGVVSQSTKAVSQMYRPIFSFAKFRNLEDTPCTQI
jgi:hypothetical protein